MQLDYAFLCSPDPLQAGSHATLTLVVSSPGKSAVACRSIVVAFPLGVSAKDRAVSAAGVETAVPGGWSVTANGGTFELQPVAGSGPVSADGLTFTFAAILLNDQPGVAHVLIEENVGDGAPATTQVPVAKFPARFALGELGCDPSEVVAPGIVTLSWTAVAVPGCTFAIEYEPGDNVPRMTVPVGNVGPLQVRNLTRRSSVTFTLVATAVVPGADAPMVLKRQVTVAVDTPDLLVWVEPPTVGVNGLVRLNWSADNVDHCLLDGAQVANAGSRYYVVTASRSFTVFGVDAQGKRYQQQAAVTVDPHIVPTETGYVLQASDGATGAPGTLSENWLGIDNSWFGGPGGKGSDAVVSWTLDPLVPVGSARVVPITVTGGVGGTGGAGGGLKRMLPMPGPGGIWTMFDASDYASGGNGGQGGNAAVTLTFDDSRPDVAQYVVSIAGGQGGVVGGPPDPKIVNTPSHGAPGTASLCVDGQPVVLG